MKILLLNQTFQPDVAATAQYLTDLTAALSARGHSVTVLTGRRSYENPKVVFAARETWRGARICRVWSTGCGKQTKLGRALDFGSFILSCCGRLAWLERHDLVVALTTPPLISFIGAWRARLWRSRFCYWVMDFNPDEAIAAGWVREDSMPARALEWMSKFSLRQANGIIALDRFMRDRIAAKGIADGKIAVIPPWSQDDTVRFDPVGRKRFRTEHGLDGKFVVMYSGNHSPVHPLDTLLEAAARLRTNLEVVFCFVGGGSDFARVRQRVEEAGLNARCLPYQPLHGLSASLSAADAQVVVMGNSFVGLVHPCKIYNILTVGAPVLYIGPQPSHLTEILDRIGQRHPWACCQHGEAGLLAEQIQKLAAGGRHEDRKIPAGLAAGFSKGVLLPQLIAELERLEK